MNWMIRPLKRYADFQGRSRRMEYWMFVLFQIILYTVLGIICSFVFAAGAPPMGPDGYTDREAAAVMMSGAFNGMFMVFGLVGLTLIIPSIAVTVRRLHDQDKSGWMILLNLIPLVGGLIVLVFMLLEGTRGPNQYGPDPKDPAAGEI